MSFLLGIGEFLKLIPRWVYEVIAVLVVIALLLALHGGWEKQAYNKAFAAGVAQQKILTDLEIRKNATDVASIGTLQGLLQQKSDESDARHQAFIDVQKADALEIAAANKRYASTKAARDSLLAIAAHPGKSACTVPPALIGDLEGL